MRNLQFVLVLMLSCHGRGCEGVAVRGGEAGRSGLDLQGPLVQFLVLQKATRIQQIVAHLGNAFDFVGSLLELPYFADHMSNLKRQNIMRKSFDACLSQTTNISKMRVFGYISISALSDVRKIHTILILAKLRSPLSVKLGVPSSMNVRSDRYMPRYGMHGGSVR